MLKFLGRGSAFNVKEGNTSAYIKQNNELFLIDCGENIFERILDKKLLDDVNTVNVLITHLNSDHVGSLSSLIYYCYYVKKIMINVMYPNEELFELLRLMGNTIEYNKVVLSEDLDNFIKSNIIDNINCSPASHIKTMDCYSYYIFLDYDNVIYYSGDCNDMPYNIQIEDWVDEFYQDTCLAEYNGNVHLSLRKLCEIVPKEYRSKVYCMHLDCEELIEKAKAEGFNVVECD